MFFSIRADVYYGIRKLFLFLFFGTAFMSIKCNAFRKRLGLFFHVSINLLMALFLSLASAGEVVIMIYFYQACNNIAQVNF